MVARQIPVLKVMGSTPILLIFSYFCLYLRRRKNIKPPEKFRKIRHCSSKMGAPTSILLILDLIPLNEIKYIFYE